MIPRHGYWRSLEQLAGDWKPTEGEFPEGAAELPAGINRREMLTLLGASISLAGLAGCRKPVEEIVPFVEAPENAIPGVAKRYATTMPLGLDAYGLVVESHDGRPTKIEGNELHPATRGGSSPWIQASILDLYDPDRSQSVRSGGAPKPWDEFVAAWKALDAEHAATGGAGLAVLSESFASPTLARLARLFEQRFPQASWTTYEPLGDDTIFGGLEFATGRPWRAMPHLERAAVVLALDADFLGLDADMVRNTRDFAAARDADRGTMNRLWVVEPHHSLTGANADHRLRLSAAEIPALLAALAAELVRGGLALGPAAGSASARPVPGLDPAWLAALAEDLLGQRGRCLVLAGRRQPPALHAAVLALNDALGNVGSTVTYREPLDARLPRDLGPLVEALRDGRVSTLVVLGGNPVHNAPADLDFAGALAGVPRKIHLAAHVDETSSLADWHVPRAHYLEAWGDARAVDGTLSVIQPLIAPLLGGKSDVELLGLLATGEDRSGHDRVRETWLSILGQEGFEPRWRRVLHDGLLAESALEPVRPPVAAEAQAALLSPPEVPPPGAQDLELEFLASPAAHDGRFANNGWLQETPDALTKLTWDNAALLGSRTASELGVRGGDVVRIVAAERSIELPAWVLPGMADHCVALWLGHGRRFGGRIAGAGGFDAYPLRSSGAPGFLRGARLEPTGRTARLATTQEHGTMTEPNVAPWQDGRPERARDVVREATFEEFRRDPEFARGHLTPPERTLWAERSYDQGAQWGMTIDLNACVGCNACIVACQSENNVPIVGREQVGEGREMHWLRVDRYFAGSTEDPQVVFQGVPCMQCENAPCEQVCPVGATVHDEQGLNVMVYNRCIGTRYCSNNCPYKVRRFNYFNFTKDTPEALKLAYNPDVTVRSRGVMEKCTYCVQRIHQGQIRAKLEGRAVGDGEIRTACQQACPAEAIRFGDLNDAASRVNEAKANPRNYVLLEELYTKPRTTFLAKLRNPHPRLAAAASDAPHDAGAAGHHG